MTKTLGNHDPNESIRLTEKEPVAKSSYKTEDPNWFAPNIPKADPYIRIKFKRLTDTAKIPCASRPGDIGFDIFADEDFSMCAGDTKKISTGIQLADMTTMDADRNRIFLKVEGRSGLSAKGIFPIGGIIDPTYRGECFVVLTRNSPESMNDPWYRQNNTGYIEYFKKGDKIAQFVIYKVATAGEAFMEETVKVTDTNRGSAGFGSSGR